MTKPAGWDLTEVMGLLRRFRDAREWRQFHHAKDLTAALAIESAELQQLFLWKDSGSAEQWATTEAGRAAIADELADILIYAAYLAERVDIDVSAAIARKVRRNEDRFPVEDHRGVADRSLRRHPATDPAE